MDPRWMRETPVDPFFAVEDAHANGRKSPRTPAELPCRIVSHYWEEAVAHHITQVSTAGAWIDTLFPLHPGAEVVLCFTPPGDDRELTLFAHVARVVTGRRRNDRKPFGMALAFADVTPEERERLEGAFCRSAA